jgi:hypothetical protein
MLRLQNGIWLKILLKKLTENDSFSFSFTIVFCLVFKGQIMCSN